MIWLWLPVTLLVVLIGYLLLAPLILEIDSDTGICRVRLHWLARADFRIQRLDVIIRITVLFWHREIAMFANQPSKTKPPEEKKPKTEKPAARRRFSSRKALAIVRSFRVRTWDVAIDTGSNVLNGMLFPVFYTISALSGKTFRISFCNELFVKLHIRNSLARVLWVYLRTKA